jgi:hypothetical protein
MNKNEIIRSSISAVILILLSVFQAITLDFGMPLKNMIIPIVINSIVIGYAIGINTPKDASESIIHGLIVSFGVYSVMYSWLYSVGFFTGSGSLALFQFGVSVFAGMIVNLITKEISNVVFKP